MTTTMTPRPGLPGRTNAPGGDRPDRVKDPVIKVQDLAWLEFEKPDLDAVERFAHDFGFATAARTDDTLYLRGALAGGQCLVVRQGPVARFVGPVFKAGERSDLDRLAAVMGTSVQPRTDVGGGAVVELRDPSGMPVCVVAGVEQLPALDRQHPLPMNVGDTSPRVNATQRPLRAPATVERLGHVALETPSFARTLDWYLEHLGMIVSDFLYFPSQRERGPAMAFVRCDRGSIPTDHHTMALVLGPGRRYVHSAYQVADLDALAAGGEHLEARGYRRSWGIGRHIQGSQIFDYWHDPDGFLFEHFTDGDLFDDSIEAGWTELAASGLAQWGPRATRDFLGATPSRELISDLVGALRDRDNEFDFGRLVGMLKVVSR